MSETTTGNAERRGDAEAEDEWLNRLADEAEAEGFEGAVTLEEMAALVVAQGG